MNATMQPPTHPINRATVPNSKPPRYVRWMWAVRTYPAAYAGGFLVLILIVGAVFAPLIAPHNPNTQFSNGLTAMGGPVAPNHEFIFGTDPEGRDVFSRVLYGARVSLEIGVFSSLISLGIGVTLGLLSGYFGGWVDMCIMRLCDTILAFPFFLFVLALVAVLQPSVTNVFIAIGVIGWANMARVVRGQVLVVRQMDYVQAAKMFGASVPSIIFMEVLPNVLGPVLVLAALAVGSNIMAEAALSFIGLGVQAPNPSWGNMLQEGLAVYQIAPWMMYAPGISLLIAVLGFNLLGDGLRDWLNPKIGQKRS